MNLSNGALSANGIDTNHRIRLMIDASVGDAKTITRNIRDRIVLNRLLALLVIMSKGMSM